MTSKKVVLTKLLYCFGGYGQMNLASYCIEPRRRSNALIRLPPLFVDKIYILFLCTDGNSNLSLVVYSVV